MKKQYNIGIELKKPKNKCDDKYCPFHNGLKVKGRIFTGTVIKISGNKSIQVEFERLFPLIKYERSEKRRTKIHAHVSPCIEVEIGDVVKIMECRPISKTKNFVVIENESN